MAVSLSTAVMVSHGVIVYTFILGLCMNAILLYVFSYYLSIVASFVLYVICLCMIRLQSSYFSTFRLKEFDFAFHTPGGG